MFLQTEGEDFYKSLKGGWYSGSKNFYIDLWKKPNSRGNFDEKSIETETNILTITVSPPAPTKIGWWGAMRRKDFGKI